MDFTHPDTGETTAGILTIVSCENTSCSGLDEVLEIYDFGTGVLCGGCGTELLEPTIIEEPEADHGHD